MSLISLYKNHTDFSRQYSQAVEDRITQASYSKKDLEVLRQYATYVDNLCPMEVDALFEKVVQIEPKGPVFEAAQKVKRCFQPLIALCEEGKKRIELAKTNPAEGPRACHWLALHLNELKVAALQNDRPAIKDAIRKIDFIQNKVREMAQISERTRILNIACDVAIEKIDPNRTLQDELYTWPGYLKAKITEVLIPGAILGLGSISYGCYQYDHLQLWINVLGLTSSSYLFFWNVDVISRRWIRTLFLKPDTTLIQQFILEENKKLERIQKEIRVVASALGLPENMNLSLEVVDKNDSICTEGFSSLNPVLQISKGDFDAYDSDLAERWKEVLREIPDHPVDLGRFLDQASFEKRRQIHQLFLEEKEALIMSQQELRGVLAHELGHLRNSDGQDNHALGILFVLAIRSLIFYTNPTKSHIGDGLFASLLEVLIRLMPVSLAVNGPLSQYNENRADTQTNVSSDYHEGLILSLKHWLVRNLVKFQRDSDSIGSSCEQQVQNMLNSFDLGKTHPNDAKRLLNVLERKGKPYEPPSRFVAAKVALIASVHLALLALEGYQIFLASKEMVN